MWRKWKKLSLYNKIEFTIVGIYFLAMAPLCLNEDCEMIFHEYLFSESFRNSPGFVKYDHICNIATIFVVIYVIVRLIYDKIKKIKSRSN